MRIFVVGNINAGKSFVIDKLSKIFKSYEIISIDGFRRIYGDGTLEKEYYAREKFIESILKHENCIVEYSGGKTITELFIDKLKTNSFIVFEIIEKVEVCLNRISSKDFSKTPYPKFSESLENTIIRLDQEYKSGCIQENFKDKYLKKFDVNSSMEISSLPLYQYELALKVSTILFDTKDTLISYGSLARDMLTLYSDIDLFLITNKSVSQIHETLKRHFGGSKFILQRNQIDLYDQQQLVELTVVTDIKDIRKYYRSGLITDVRKTLLFGDSSALSTLSEYAVSSNHNLIEEFDYTISRLDYYCESLKRLIPKMDEYKYYFHSNIVIHEYVRLEYFISGGRAFAYLPKNANRLINDISLNQMVYHFGDNQLEHYERLRTLVDSLIDKANQYKIMFLDSQA